MTGEKPDAAPKVKEDEKFDASLHVGNRDTWLEIKVREKTALLPHAEHTHAHAVMRGSNTRV